MRSKQTSFTKTNWKFRYSHGGNLRKKRAGRMARPLSTRDPLHLIFKINQSRLPLGLKHPKSQSIVRGVINQYSKRFFIRIEQVAIEYDHLHLHVRASKRIQFQSFFRVVAGQIAQRLMTVTDTRTKLQSKPKTAGLLEKFWKERPFTRVVKSLTGYKTIRNYVQLNHKEATGQRPYRKERLRGMSKEEIDELWA